MKNVLLISDSSQEYYFEPFIGPCTKEEVRLLLFEPGRFPAATAFDLRMVDGAVLGEIEVKDLVTSKTLSLPVSEINLAWYLRPNRTMASEELTVHERNFATSESEAALDALWSVLPCKWINSKAAIARLESNKLLQQSIAAACGLRTPPTVISNRYDAVLEFAGPRSALLLKTFSYAQFDDKGELFIFSQLFSQEEIRSAQAAIRNCPIFAQHYVDKLYEYRVMVIGDEVLACRIDSQASEKTKIDWRHYDFDLVEHTAIDLPQSTRRKLLDFMDRAGLRFGAIDLIETPDHEFVFLEINPSGQWDWIAKLSHLPIPAVVGSMLAKN